MDLVRYAESAGHEYDYEIEPRVLDGRNEAMIASECKVQNVQCTYARLRSLPRPQI